MRIARQGGHRLQVQAQLSGGLPTANLLWDEGCHIMNCWRPICQVHALLGRKSEQAPLYE